MLEHKFEPFFQGDKTTKTNQRSAGFFLYLVAQTPIGTRGQSELFMLRKIRKIVGHSLNKEKNPYSSFRVAGVSLRGIEGTERTAPDQDDAWFFALAREAEVLFDIGSNIGFMSLLAAIQPRNKAVVLVDPNPEALAKASQNLIINGFGHKSRFISSFVGDKVGEQVKFFTVGSGEAGSMYASHAETASAVNSYYFVSQTTVDDLVLKQGVVPDLVKVDVEGAEHLVLAGATKLASSGRTQFMIEMHSNKDLSMLENASRVLKWCTENQYNAYYLKTKERLLLPETIADRGKCHLLLLPARIEFPKSLLNIAPRDPLPSSLLH